jgi:hypothetical protein
MVETIHSSISFGVPDSTILELVISLRKLDEPGHEDETKELEANLRP